ncbi:MAG: PHP domain-containing protein [Ruminococcaceae bacterium]|nr:PHP domain-containing protein [Oscillospiraceae bacterium]
MKIDMHVHTSQASLCACVDAKETVQMYKDAGYDGIVLTNHYNIYQFPFYENSPHKTAENFICAYENAKEEGDKIGLKVLLGCELSFTDSNNDYLLYGLDCDFIEFIADKLNVSFSEFLKYKPENTLIYQAHPFRNHMKITPPQLLDGIESYNGNPRHDSRNEIAKEWAKKFSLKTVSGSDFHQPEDIAIGGIVTEKLIKDNTDLIELLKSQEYELIKK